MDKRIIIKEAQKLLMQHIDNGSPERLIMNINIVSNTGNLAAVIPKDNDGYCTVYKMDCTDGLGLLTVYQVYPGIQPIYNDFEAASCEWEGTLNKNILEINHCREGREGSRLLSGSCLYLGEGDLSIHTMDNCAPEILSESGIGLLEFKEKFCTDGKCFIMRAKDEINHICSELYSVPDCLQKP